MKQFKLLLLFLVIGFITEAQPNYLPNRSRNIWIAGKFDSTLHIPFGTTPSLRTGGHTGSGAVFYKTSDSTIYVYTGTQWISVKGAGGSADSTIFATLYRIDTAKSNIRTTLNTKIDSMRRVGLNVQAYKNGTWITQFTDSVGSGSGDGIVSLGTSAYGLITQNDSTYKVDSALLSTKLWRQKGIDSVQANINLKVNISDTASMLTNYVRAQRLIDTAAAIRADMVSGGSVVDSIKVVGDEFLLYQTGGSDLHAYLYPTILDIDSTYEPLAGQINDSLWRLKSLRLQFGGSTITPTVDGNKINWNITGVSGGSTGIRFDSSYTPMGGSRGADSFVVKSIRIRRNNITVTPTQTGDSAMYWNIDVPSVADSAAVLRSRYDSAHYNIDLLNDSTVVFISFNGQRDTLQFHAGAAADSVIYATVHRTDTLAQNIRGEIAALPAPTLQQVFATESNNALMDGNFKVNVNGHDIDFDEAVNGFITVVSYFSMVGGDSLNMQSGQGNRILLKSDTIFIKPILGNLNIDSLNSGSSSDSVLVWDQSTGMVKKRNSSDFGGVGGTYYIGTYNSQTINGDGASIVGDSIYMQEFSAESPGLVPAGGSGTTYLRGDATWQTISSGSPAGNNGDIQFNRDGSFTAAGSDSLRLNGSSFETKAEFSLMGTKTINFGTGSTNPEITATTTALIFRNNSYGAYTDVTLGTLNANSFSTTGNGSIAGKLSVTTGTNKSAGTGTLASGTATISTNNVTANSLIFIQYTSCSSCGSTYISAKTASTSFVVTSTNGSDASTFNWWIIN